MTLVEDIVVKRPGQVPYGEALRAMREFTTGRTDATPDEIWIVEHPPVYTLGQGATTGLNPDLGIAVVASDRGGDITYHGPGQAVLYTLVDLARRRITVKRFVWLLEQAVIDLVGTRAERRPGARRARESRPAWRAARAAQCGWSWPGLCALRRLHAWSRRWTRMRQSFSPVSLTVQ